MRKLLFLALSLGGVIFSLSAQEQFLGIPYEEMRTLRDAETGLNKERLRRFVIFEEELYNMRAKGLQRFVASGVSDSMRARIDARIKAVNGVDSLALMYRKARLADDQEKANEIYFEYLKSLSVLDMRSDFLDMFKGLEPMGPELYLRPGESIAKEEEAVVVQEPEPEAPPVVEEKPKPVMVEPIRGHRGADNWNFWLGAGINYNLPLSADTLSVFDNDPDQNYRSYSEANFGYSAHLGFARKLGGAFSIFVEGGVNYSSFSYIIDYTNDLDNSYYSSTEEFELMQWQGTAGFKIRLRRLDLRLGYRYQESLESTVYWTDFDQDQSFNEDTKIDLDELDQYNASRGAIMFEMAFSMVRRGRSPRQGDLQFYLRSTYELDNVIDLEAANSNLEYFNLAQLHIGLRFQY